MPYGGHQSVCNTHQVCNDPAQGYAAGEEDQGGTLKYMLIVCFWDHDSRRLLICSIQ